MAGGMCGRACTCQRGMHAGSVWKEGVCMAGGACMAGRGGGTWVAGGHAWQGASMSGVGHCGRGAGGMCSRGDMCGRGVCMVRMPPHQILRDMVGQCAGGTHPTGVHSCSKENT